jgi:DNA repair photolyase
MEKQIFEKAGLKIDSNRVLTYSELHCPLDCTYCFVDEMDTNQKQKVTYLTDRQFELLGQLPEEVELIMLGCDTEFFQQRDNALQILERLALLNKDLSVITKLHLNKDFIKKIGEIDRKMRSRGNVLAFSVSIPCFTSSDRWEPKAPSPEKRVETLQHAFDENLMTMVAIRPLIPTVTDSELQRIVEQTKDIASGYYSGPLYLKNYDSGLLAPSETTGLKIEKIQPHWMLEGNEFYRVERPGQMDYLRQLLTKAGKPLFDGAGEGIERLK